MTRRVVSWMLILVLFLPYAFSSAKESLSVSFASCTVENGGTAACGETVVFSIASTGADQTQLMIVPPDSSRKGMDGPICSVTLDTPGTWAFVAYARDSKKNTVHSEQWRITVEGGSTEQNRLLTAEERYINHFFTEDFANYSEDGRKLKHWLDYQEKKDIESRNNSGYLLLEEEMVWQDGFLQRMGAGYVFGSELAMNTVSNFGLNLLVDAENNQQWKNVFPTTGAAAVPYYEMLGNFFYDYTNTVSSFAKDFDSAMEFIYSETGGGAENILNTVAALPDGLRDLSDDALNYSKKTYSVRQVCGVFAEILQTYQTEDPAHPGTYITGKVGYSSLRDFLEAKLALLSAETGLILRNGAESAVGPIADAADNLEPAAQKAGEKSILAGKTNLAMKWTNFFLNLSKYNNEQLLFSLCFMQITNDFLNALTTWRDDEGRYGDIDPLREALDLLIVQICRVAYEEMEEYQKGASSVEIALRLSAESFISATLETAKYFIMPELESLLKSKAWYGKLMGASAVTGAGSFILNLIDHVSNYSEWRETVKTIYLIKKSLSDSIFLQLEAYRADPGYSGAVTLIESLNLLKFLKQAGEKTILLDYMGNRFSELPPAGLSVLMCELLNADDKPITYPSAEFDPIEVVEYRDIQPSADSKLLHYNSRVLGYYSDDSLTFAGRKLSPLPSVYQVYCLETGDPSSMDIIRTIDSTWITGNQLPNLDLQYISAQHELILKNIPGLAEPVSSCEADENEAVEITEFYNPDLLTGDGGFYYELVRGQVNAYKNDSMIITLTQDELRNYLSVESSIREELIQYESSLSHSENETKEHQAEELWIWMNVTSGYINSVDMFDDWLRKNF